MLKDKYIYLALIYLVLNPNSIFSQESWTFRESMPTARSGICAVVLDGKIYVMGGRDENGSVLDIVERYDPQTDNWETGFSEMEEERENAAAVIFDGIIFVLGGKKKENKILKKVEFFNIEKNKWEDFKELDEKREGLSAVVVNNTMYALGGSSDKGDILKTIESFDAGEEEWKMFNQWHLDFPRVLFAAVVVDDSVFTLGGFTTFGPIGFVQRFHFATGAEQRREFSIPRAGLAATVLNDQIFIMGGRNAYDRVLSSVQFYIPEQNQWFDYASMNTSRENFAAVTVDNSIYVIGGRDSTGKTLASVEVSNITPNIVQKKSLVLEKYVLQQNYPNPFNAGTKINFQLSAGSRASHIRLVIYNLNGQVITTLVDSAFIPGNHDVFWDGTDMQGLPVASGLYIYILQNEQSKISKKMLLIR